VICSSILPVASREVTVSLNISPNDTLIIENVFEERQMRLYTFACGNTTAIDALSPPTISIYPNPTNGTVYIPEVDMPAYVRVCTALGKLLTRLEVLGDKVMLEHLSDGMYLLEVVDKKTHSILSRTKIIKNTRE
jgi:hypothetical protein